MSDEAIEQKINGIPEAEKESAREMFDPVTWAAAHLDWHCLDPVNEVWKRKDITGYNRRLEKEDGDEKALYGKSPYHRPYQAKMLRCTSKRKICRIGRQSGKTEVLVVDAALHGVLQPYHTPGKRYRIVVIAPYQSQVEVFYERLLELFNQSPDFGEVVKKARRSPTWTIELKNGTIYRFFTAGVSSASHSNSVRGQTADVLIFDEADMLGEEDINSALAPIINLPEALIWMSSTPTGKREMFYKNCKSKFWKEYHFSSYVNPNWSPEQEALFRDQCTEMGYIHEILAEFGEQEQGVFQVRYVQRAQRDYEYGSLAYNPLWHYTMGIDWNDARNGINISVLGFDPSRNVFQLVWRDIINKTEFTQLEACQQVVDLNALWHPIAIYADAGYGKTQIEVLHNFSGAALSDPNRGPRHPDAKIKDILKKYDFGSSLEVFDFWSKNKIKKDAKAFMVESAVRRFETGDILIPRGDALLERQMLNYIVDHVSQNGRTVYKSDDPVNIGDHLLDSFMLAIVGYILEATPLGKPVYVDKILFTGQPGMKRGYDTVPAEFIINPDVKHKTKQEREAKMPDLGRSELFDGTGAATLGSKFDHSLPAANLSEGHANRPLTQAEFSADIIRSKNGQSQTARLRSMRRQAHARRFGTGRANI